MTVTSLRALVVRRERRTPMAEAAIQWIVWAGAVLLIVGSIVPVLYAAVRDRPLYEDGGSFTLANYSEFLTDPAFWSALGNTAYYAILTAVPAVIIGTGLAVVVTRTNLPLRRLIGVLMVIPLLFPGLGMTLGWVSMYSPSGFVSTWVTQTFGGVPWNLYSIAGMAMVSLEKTVPLVYLFARARLSTLDTSIEDAALSAGATPVRVLRNITLPMMRPSLIMAAILITMVAFESLGLPLILGTPSGIETLSTYLYNNWTRAAGNQGLVSAAATMLLLIVTGLFLLRARFEGNAARFVTTAGKPKARRQLELGPVKWLISAACLAYVAMAIVLPAAGLVMTSITDFFSPLVAPWDVLTTRHFETVFQSRTFFRAVTNSLIIGIVGGILATAGLAATAMVAHRSRFRLRATLPTLMFYPRSMPGIVVGMGFFWAFILITPLEPLRTTIWGIMIAFIVRNTAIGYAAIQSTLLSISEELDAAARTCGASWLTSGRTIVLPLLRPALATCFILMFVSLLNDYDPAVFLVTSGNEVMGLTMLQQWLAGFTGPVAALGVIQLSITAAVLGLGRLLLGVKPNA